jgi:Ion channel
MTDRGRGRPAGHVMRGGRGFFGLICLIAATFVWGMSVSGSEVATFGFVVLASATLLGSVWLTGSSRRTVVIWAIVCSAAILSSGVALLSDVDRARTFTTLVTVGLVVVAPGSLIRAIVRQPVVDRHTIGGVVSLYLLIGMFFATVYAAVEAVDGSFFTGIDNAQYSDFLYYSYVTVTTLGYGDLTTELDFGRALSVTEALMGQVYLVTVVALVIGNLGARRSSI